MAGDAPKRMDAIKLAKASKWEELKRLVDAEPLAAQQVDSYGMLPLHWACTEPHSISEGVLMSLLKAFPQGARAVNTAEMLPLQIAIKAQAKIEWLQALLASYPDAVLKKVPSGEHAVQLARKANLPARSVKLLEEMFHHVCEKAGYSSDQLGYDDQQQQRHDGHSEYQSGGADDRGMAQPRGSNGYPASKNSGSSRRGGPDSFKTRAFSDNDFQVYNGDSLRSTAASDSSFRATATMSVGPMGSKSQNMATTPMSPYPGASSMAASSSSVRMSNRAVVSLPPRWVMAPNCHICSQKFKTPFKKRHHCRNCGQTICSDHSARERMRLPHFGLNDRHRVCTVCHDLLRNASRQAVQQPNQPRFTQAHATPARRSDEAAQRLPEGLSIPPQMLERHVSAPARQNMDTTPYHGIHDQVASLQMQVSLLMEEKELAESQLRAQAELLGEVDPERMTNYNHRGSRGSHRDRQNSYPAKLPSGASTSEGGSGMPSLLTAYNSYESSRMMPRSNSNHRIIPRTNSGSNFRGREVDIDRASDIPDQAPEPVRVPIPEPLSMAPFQDEFSHLTTTVDSTYDAHSDGSEERPTEGFGDLHDTDDDDDDQMPSHEDEADDDEADDDEADDDEADDDDEGDYGTLPEIDVMVNLGLSMMDRGMVSAAVQAFARAVDMCPNDATLHSYLGRAFYADDNLDDAVVALTRSVELEPSATNSTLLGKILYEKGDHEKAIEAYQKSLEVRKA